MSAETDQSEKKWCDDTVGFDGPEPVTGIELDSLADIVQFGHLGGRNRNCRVADLSPERLLSDSLSLIK